ncbi:MAG TPA: acyl-ACP--UDP-N-acetylglucosamine O-acyltransferase [Candidatus Baltobacteraceae bacterium]
MLDVKAGTTHPTAIVHPRARIARGVEIGPFCIVGEHVTIGTGTVLQANVVVNGWTQIGEDCQIFPFATVGATSQDRKYVGEAAFTKIGNRTVLREYVSVQRATGEGETTVVGDDCLLLAYVHVAHNCTIANHVTMSNLAQLAGHCTIGDHATVGGMAGMHQFVRVGRYAMVGGATKITKDIPPFLLVEGGRDGPSGLNAVGLRRAEFSVEERAEIKRFYRLMYSSKLNTSQALEQMRATVTTAPGRDMIAFVEAPSHRGIIK